ncbi:MAG: DUF2141 domain-containing protein [Rhodobacterales bacterium]|nr:DUF2141 domain-containing protein [Rhodobacterales bacterium]
MTAVLRALVLATGLFPALAAPAQAALLTVTVTGLTPVKGNLRVALYDDPKLFPDGDGSIDGLTLPVNGADVTGAFSGLEPGRYAIAIHHDLNGDGHFDTNLVGYPLEGYGFSNDARGLLGPPAFAAAAVDLGDDGLAITITVRYGP